MRPSKRDLWRDVGALKPPADVEITVSSNVVEVTDPETDSVDVPEGARILETQSDVVTVWVPPSTES